jgi:hypothetical protein
MLCAEKKTYLLTMWRSHWSASAPPSTLSDLTAHLRKDATQTADFLEMDLAVVASIVRLVE